MSHLLGLLFEYHRYKKDTIMRVYADDQLVDELLLTEDITLKAKKYRARPPFNDGKGSGWSDLPDKLFVFELDQKHLQKSLRIEVINDNNNYTNGFMTDFSYITFYALFLVPRCLLIQDNWRKLGRFINRKWDSEDPKRTPDDFNFFPYRTPRHSDIIVRSSSNEWKDTLLWEKRGGSFDIEIPLYRKHGQIHIAKPKPGRMDLHPYAFKVLSVFNKLNTSV